MKTLYIDCSNGISGDMLRKALDQLAGLETDHDDMAGSHHQGVHEHVHRSYADVQKIIGESDKSQGVKEIALSIYEVIAKAEAKVHETNPEGLHFHEVGRDQAIANALRIGEAVERLDLDRIVVSPICDGRGFVDCAHGRIPVPVPAVRAMMEECGREYSNFEFKQLEEVETEMVTPSGLASLIGIGSVPAPGGMMFMEGQITGAVEVNGTRNTGRGGLRAYLIEK